MRSVPRAVFAGVSHPFHRGVFEAFRNIQKWRASILQKTLDEEKTVDEKLTSLAEGKVNLRAAR